MKKNLSVLVFLFFSGITLFAQLNECPPTIRTVNGKLEGLNISGIKEFRGIPFAQPPVGSLRWKAPQPVKNWKGVRKAITFGPRPMQMPIFNDMVFRSDTVSEDCLYLNVWTPAKTGKEKLPVLVYFYGGGLMAGSSDEYRYDGEMMARKGIVVVTPNYRLGIFGFFAHPELTKESPHHTSGNYGYLDQLAALQWVKENIAAFGGDPDHVTIAGESAGSISVSAQMCSPLSKDLFIGAIGSSGSLLGALPPIPIQEAEKNGLKVAESLHASSIKDLRAISGTDLLKVRGMFSSTIDGYFFPEAPVAIYTKGNQAHIPVLIGGNSEEMDQNMVLRGKEPTLDNLKAGMARIYKDKADTLLKLYGATDSTSVIPAAIAFASDIFIGFSTWKWCDMQQKTSEKPVFRYLYTHPRPAKAGTKSDIKESRDIGARHSADIEYAMGNLTTNKVYDWQPEDYRVSALFMQYYANFIKTGNPNGLGLPDWPPINGKQVPPVLHLDVKTYIFQDAGIEKRYHFLDKVYFPKE